MPKESRRRDSDSSREKKKIKLFLQALSRLESDRRSSSDNDSSSSEDIQNNEQVHEVQVHREDVKIASEPGNNEGEQLKNDNINISQFSSSEPNTDTEPIWGPEVKPDMASHWNKFTELGIEESEKKELLKKYPVPKNMTYLKSPILNPEIMENLEDVQRKEDECMSTIQGQIGNGLSALAVAVDTFSKENDSVKLERQLVPQLTDAGKILTDVFHMLSTNRKYRLEPHMNRNIVLESKSDRFLYGQDFPKKVEDMQTGIALNDMPPTKVATNSDSQNASTSLAGSSNYQRQNKKIRVNNENREKIRKQAENIPANSHPISEATLKTYSVSYKKWEDFCQKNDLDSSEPEIDDIIAFFKESLAGGASVNRLSNDRSALQYFFEFTNDDKNSIKKFFKELKINHPSVPEQVIDIDPTNFIQSWNQAENADNFEN